MSQFKSTPYILFDILRIFTPIKIARMTKISTGVQKVSLTSLMLKKESGNTQSNQKRKVQKSEIKEGKKSEDNVLAFPNANENGQNSSVLNQEQNQVAVGGGSVSQEVQVTSSSSPDEAHLSSVKTEDLNLEMSDEERRLSNLGIASQKEVAARQALMESEANAKKESTSVFILKEKEKLREGQNKLRMKEVVHSYSETGSVEVEKKSPQTSQSDEKKQESDMGEIISSKTSGILVNKNQR